MKGLIAYFVIVCLSLASGAPTNEESKVISKSFNYGDKGVIYSVDPFWKDEMVYAVCEGSGVEKKCKVYVESTNPDKKTFEPCDINLKYKNRYDFNVALYNAGNFKGVFAVSDGDTKTKLISVNLDGCEIKEASVDAVPKSLPLPALFFTNAVIVSHNDNYDVFFHNDKVCHDFLCKATFDYKGNVVKAVSTFPVRDLDFNIYDIKYVNNAYLVSDIHYESNNIFLIHNNDKEPRTLFNGTGGAVGLSTEENKLGYCAFYDDRKLLCRQYDAEGKTKKTEVNITIGEVGIEFLDVLNLEKGLLLLSIQRNSHTKHVREIFVAHYDEEGKEGKYVKLDLKCDDPKTVFAKLYKDSDGKFCVSSICMLDLGSSGKHSEFSRNTRCFQEAELFYVRNNKYNEH